MIYTILIAVQVVVALSLIVLILLQHGKGADAGAAFGSGASGTVFGAKGTANFMSRVTAALATVFMLCSLTLAYLVNGAAAGGGTSVTDKLMQSHSQSGAPAASSQAPTAKTGSGATALPAAGKPGEKPSGSSNGQNNGHNKEPKIPN